jgi:hypothetical protein
MASTAKRTTKGTLQKMLFDMGFKDIDVQQ